MLPQKQSLHPRLPVWSAHSPCMLPGPYLSSFSRTATLQSVDGFLVKDPNISPPTSSLCSLGPCHPWTTPQLIPLSSSRTPSPNFLVHLVHLDSQVGFLPVFRRPNFVRALKSSLFCKAACLEMPVPRIDFSRALRPRAQQHAANLLLPHRPTNPTIGSCPFETSRLQNGARFLSRLATLIRSCYSETAPCPTSCSAAPRRGETVASARRGSERGCPPASPNILRALCELRCADATSARGTVEAKP